MFSCGLVGTISNAVGAFVDMESFNVEHNHLVGSFPASMSAWKKVASFDVRENRLAAALPELNFGVMDSCDLLDKDTAFPELFNHFSPFFFGPVVA